MRRLVSTHTPVLLLLAFVSEAGAVSELRITFTESRGNLGSCCTHGQSVESCLSHLGSLPCGGWLPRPSLRYHSGVAPLEAWEACLAGLQAG